MNRQEHEKKLQLLFGFHSFYDDQWYTIERIFNQKRVILIEKTGFGKSLTYQYPATQFPGITIIFSPLIALMRDQVKNLNDKGVKAGLVNCEQTLEENDLTIQKAINNELKIIYIAPERLENSTWQEDVGKMNISFVVIDEAHCISSWGHDFRPPFRRIINLMKILPAHTPVLATTATATNEVAGDIKNQIGGDIEIIRGNLLRNNFHLNIIKLASNEDKMAWIYNYLWRHEGNGLIYTGTRSDAEIFSKWCESQKLNTIFYHAGLDSESRKSIENDWMKNKYKAVISTNALGMGIDKSDIRFIIHTQIPQSPIHYYQEIGRAGRDGKDTDIFLLYNESKDNELPKSFINGARPSTDKYEKVIHILKEELLGMRELTKASNIKQNQIMTIKADLIDQKIIKEILVGKNKKYQYQHNAPILNTEFFENLRNFRLTELDKMIEYTKTKECKMSYLCNYLGDNIKNNCGKCESCLNQKNDYKTDNDTQEKISQFQEDFFPILEVLSNKTNLVDGFASSYYGFSNIGHIIHRCKYEGGGDYTDELIKQTLRAYHKKLKHYGFDIILFVPPTKSGKLVENFANKIGVTIKLPVYPIFKKRETKEQKIFQTSFLKIENIQDVFDIQQDMDGKKILLIDDIYDSGATIKEIGKMLTNKGAILIAPLVIAKTVGGDDI